MSAAERRTSNGFLPLYDLTKMPDISNIDDSAKKILDLSQVWFSAATDLLISKYLYDDGILKRYKEYCNFHNIVILYCLRHALELGIKSYLEANDPDYKNSKELKNSHNLKKLYDKSKLYDLFCKYDDEYHWHGDAATIRKFIYWFSEYEGSNENRYRYPIVGKNPMQENNQFVNFNRILNYVQYFSNICKYGKEQGHVKTMNEQNMKKTYCLRPRREHISKRREEQANKTVQEIHKYWETHEPDISSIDCEKLVREGIAGWMDI